MEKGNNSFLNDFRNNEENNDLLRNNIVDEDSSFINQNSNIQSSFIKDLLYINEVSSNTHYLKIRIIEEFSEKEFEELKLKYNKLSIDQLIEIINEYKIEDCKIVKLISSINEIIENDFKYDEEKTYKISIDKQLFGEIGFYRPIKGDGNCFYRAVIFRYFEIIILNQNLSLLRNIINDINKTYSDNFIEKFMKMNIYDPSLVVKPRLIIYIFIIIYNFLKEGKINDSYKIFVLSINNCSKFDYGLILYFKYILYKYINDNEYKCFTKENSLEIKNLLPDKYINDEKGFDDYYETSLLVFGKFAEKIVLYITPYVLNIKLNIFADENIGDNKIISFDFKGKPKYKFKDDITILYKNCHYDLLYYNQIKNDLYLKNYIKNYEFIYSELINSYNEKILIKNEIDNKDKSNCLNCKELFNSQNNKTKLCEKCLFNEINEQIFIMYFQYLYINQKIFNFYQQKIKLNNEDYNLEELMNIILNSSLPNKPKSFIDFIKLTKLKFCINCKEENKKPYYYCFPCFCTFCSDLCFRNFFKKYNYNNFQNCPHCKKKFTNEEMLSIFNKLYEGKCCIDGLLYTSNYSKKIPRTGFYIPNELNYYFEHYICNDCLNQMEYTYSKRQFQCKICHKEHYYLLD